MALLDDIRKTLGQTTPGPQAAAQAASAQAVANVAQAASGKVGPTVQVQETPALLQAQQSAKDQAAQLQAQTAATGAVLAGAQQQAESEAALGQQRLNTQATEAAAALRAGTAEAGAQRAASQTMFNAQQTAKIDSFSRDLAQRNQVALNRLATERGITTADIFADHRAGVQELDFRKDAAALEQKAQMLAMADREYVRNMVQTGLSNRLDNELSYKAEVQRIMLGDQLDSLLRGQNAESILTADNRTFNEFISKIDPQTALAITQQESRDATMRAGVQSAGAVAEGVAKNKDAFKGTPDNTGVTPHQSDTGYRDYPDVPGNA